MEQLVSSAEAATATLTPTEQEGLSSHTSAGTPPRQVGSQAMKHGRITLAYSADNLATVAKRYLLPTAHARLQS